MGKIKVILFDVDGVLIRLPYYVSKKLERQGYKNAEQSLNSFFNGEDYYKCLEGKTDAKEMIMPYLKKFDWDDAVEAYFIKQFQFEEKYLDPNLISLVSKLKNQNIRCCLGTDQEKTRAKFLLNDMNFQNIFDRYYISCYIGYRKCQDGFWIHVLEDIKKEFKEIKTDEIVFFDDLQINIEAALKSGIQAFLFTDINQFKKDLVSLNII